MMSRRIGFLAVLICYALFCRLLPYAMAYFGMSIDPATTWYPWNFSPLMAIALFGGAVTLDRRWSLVLPLGVMLLSDIGILLLTRDPNFVFTPSQPLVYGCFAAVAMTGWLLRSQPQLMTSVPLAMACEGVFFLVTNFAVWASGEGDTYPMTLQGLALCYTMGLPFLGRSLVSTSLYTIALFSPAGLAAAGVTPAGVRDTSADHSTSHVETRTERHS